MQNTHNFSEEQLPQGQLPLHTWHFGTFSISILMPYIHTYIRLLVLRLWQKLDQRCISVSVQK